MHTKRDIWRVQMDVLFVGGQYNVWELTPVTESDSAISMKQECVLRWLPVLCKGGEYETFQVNKTFTSHQYRCENRTHAERG